MLTPSRFVSRAGAAVRACVEAWQAGGTAELRRVVREALYWRFHPRVRRWAAELPREERLDLEFDRRFGTDTAGEVPLEAVGIEGSEIERGHGRYRPVWTHVFRESLDRLGIDYRAYTFVDYGSGKGKALLLASDYPFAEIVGVEFARPLHEAAVRNIEKYSSQTQRCTRLRSECADATAFDPPPTPLVCFFFNPFDEGTTSVVLDRLRRSFDDNHRPIYVIYTNMRDVREHEGIFKGHPGLSPVAEGPRYLALRFKNVPARPAPF